jgi:hypothetical protein
MVNLSSFAPATGTNFVVSGTGVAYGNGRWVAVGYNGSFNATILTSTDGISWTNVTTINGTFGVLKSVAYNGSNLWVAVGNDILTSSDGLVWNQTTSIPTYYSAFQSVAFGGGKWVVLCSDINKYGRTIMTSDDGMTWIAGQGIPFSYWGYGAFFAEGKWLAVGDDSTYGSGYNLLTSTDGLNWGSVSNTNFSTTTVSISIHYGNGLWVATRFGAPTIITSSNGGVTWAAASGTPFNNDGGIAVAFGNGNWVAVGRGGGNILTSTNGTSWSPASGIIPTEQFSVAYGNKRWVTTNSNASGRKILYASEENTPCFLEGSKILTDKGYVHIENIRKGDMVKTVENGFVPAEYVGVREIIHPCSSERIGDQLYVCPAKNYPELTEDLVITGYHSLLVKEFANDQERDASEKALGRICLTDDHYRLPACVDQRAEVYPEKGNFKIYHLALEHPNYYMNYGIYANGLLVETTSRRYMLELSGMTLLE